MEEKVFNNNLFCFYVQETEYQEEANSPPVLTGSA
jgi:hypothetical protein